MVDIQAPAPVPRSEFDSKLDQLYRAIEQQGKTFMEALQAEAQMRRQESTELREEVRRSRPNFGVLGTWTGVAVTVVIAVVGLGAWGLSIQSAHNRNDIEDVSQYLIAHISDGHPRRVEERVEGVRSIVESLTDRFEAHANGKGHLGALEEFSLIKGQLGSITGRQDEIAGRVSALEESTYNNYTRRWEKDDHYKYADAVEKRLDRIEDRVFGEGEP